MRVCRGDRTNNWYLGRLLAWICSGRPETAAVRVQLDEPRSTQGGVRATTLSDLGLARCYKKLAVDAVWRQKLLTTHLVLVSTGIARGCNALMLNRVLHTGAPHEHASDRMMHQ